MKNIPLAQQLRPTKIEDFLGQEHLFKKNEGIIYKMIENNHFMSMIFYGPSGCGKTTAAQLLTNYFKHSAFFNASIQNKNELDSIIQEAKLCNNFLLIVDEIHRLNKDKQDILLPYLENGTITMIGLTTSNPFFAINSAILSRIILAEFKPLKQKHIQKLLNKIPNLNYDSEIIETLTTCSNGDLRITLNIIEMLLYNFSNQQINNQLIKKIMPTAIIAYDKDGDNYYNLLSALQKSIRGSDVNASLYYLGQLLNVGDLLHLTRRLIVCAYEDIGLANPNCCNNVYLAVQSALMVGLPEAKLILSPIVIQMALSPKSQSAKLAINNTLNLISNHKYNMPDYLILNGTDKTYDYDAKNLWHTWQYLPDEIKEQNFYIPQNNSSFEKALNENYAKLAQIKRHKIKKTD